jgi:hypothetical protein
VVNPDGEGWLMPGPGPPGTPISAEGEGPGNPGPVNAVLGGRFGGVPCAIASAGLAISAAAIKTDLADMTFVLNLAGMAVSLRHSRHPQGQRAVASPVPPLASRCRG